MNIFFNLNRFEVYSMRILFIFILFNTTSFFAQNYRTATSYINDFGKNELYIKESLLEYNKTMTVATVNGRTDVTLNTIYYKLQNINAILIKNDKGFENDITLRDAFISLNNKTLDLFKNNVLMLNDYDQMSKKSIEEIDAIFSRNQVELKKYYNAVSNYEKTKREFGLKYKIKINSFLTKNVLEYNAKENFIFYKIGVIDEKFTSLIKDEKTEEAKACLLYLTKMSAISLHELASYTQKTDEITVNNANKSYIEFIKNNNIVLNTFYLKYEKLKIELALAKKDSNLSIEKYNEKVREYNTIKNSYLAEYGTIQNGKQLMANKFHEANSAYLKKNIQFKNNHTRYIEKN